MGTKDILNLIGLGDRLKSYRAATGKTQAQIADAAGIAASSYANYENGNRVPSTEILLKIADALGVSTSALVTESVSAATVASQLAESSSSTANIVSSILDQEPSSSDAIKAALWGGDKDLSEEDLDALWEDVREYAAFKAQQRKKGKTPSPDKSKDG